MRPKKEEEAGFLAAVPGPRTAPGASSDLTSALCSRPSEYSLRVLRSLAFSISSRSASMCRRSSTGTWAASSMTFSMRSLESCSSDRTPSGTWPLLLRCLREVCSSSFRSSRSVRVKFSSNSRRRCSASDTSRTPPGIPGSEVTWPGGICPTEPLPGCPGTPPGPIPPGEPPRAALSMSTRSSWERRDMTSLASAAFCPLACAITSFRWASRRATSMRAALSVSDPPPP
mmetsp:Transcript_10032/g.23331  ORF Transcript_10032/g.23331 Transcript_10032/m.23331 type:complete len:229 (+) Transcript_10032:237-923(+)